MQPRALLPLCVLVVVCCLHSSASAQNTAFFYQGRLMDGGLPANGDYDLQFKLHDGTPSGTQVGDIVSLAPVQVRNGLFTVTLDFGGAVFNGGTRWMEIGVRTNGSTVPYIFLSPAQLLTAAPYAVRAASAAAVSGVVGDAQLSTNIPRLNSSATFTGVMQISNPASMFNGTFSGNAAGLSNLNAGSLSGVVPGAALVSARLTNSVLYASNFAGTFQIPYWDPGSMAGRAIMYDQSNQVIMELRHAGVQPNGNDEGANNNVIYFGPKNAFAFLMQSPGNHTNDSLRMTFIFADELYTWRWRSTNLFIDPGSRGVDAFRILGHDSAGSGAKNLWFGDANLTNNILGKTLRFSGVMYGDGSGLTNVTANSGIAIQNGAGNNTTLTNLNVVGHLLLSTNLVMDADPGQTLRIGRGDYFTAIDFFGYVVGVELTRNTLNFDPFNAGDSYGLLAAGSYPMIKFDADRQLITLFTTTTNAADVDTAGDSTIWGILSSKSTASIPTNSAAYGTIANPIVSGMFWTNTTGARVTLYVNYSLMTSASSGAPSLCMTNVTTGDWFNATNSLPLDTVASGRAPFSLSPNDYFIATNQSSGRAIATVDGSMAIKQ